MLSACLGEFEWLLTFFGLKESGFKKCVLLMGLPFKTSLWHFLFYNLFWNFAECLNVVFQPTSSCDEIPGIAPEGDCPDLKTDQKRFAYFKAKCVKYSLETCEPSDNAWKSKQECSESEYNCHQFLQYFILK